MLGLAAFVAVLAQLFYLSAQKQSAELALLRQAAREDYLLARQSRQQDEEVRRMYHDLKHQLTALQGVQDEQRKTEMVSSMLQHISAYEQVVESGNELVDALLARRVRAAREQGVQVELLLEACDYSFIEDADLCAIFGNAVDNAVEAVQRLPEGQPRTVTLKSAVMQGLGVAVLSELAVRQEAADGRLLVFEPHQGAITRRIYMALRRDAALSRGERDFAAYVKETTRGKYHR